VLALDYLRRSRRTTPESEMKALEYINVGYQRLLTFEIQGGGFDWYGRPPANLILSAYGLLQFIDMAKVYEIDTRVIDRTKTYLLKNQQKDGSWKVPERTSYSWKGVTGDFVVTAYVAWSLLEAGFKGAEMDRAIKWLKANVKEVKDTYALALTANAFAAYDPKSDDTEALIGQLDDIKVDDRENGVVYWKQDGSTAFHARGSYAAVETTALVAYAMMKTPRFANTINRALTYLVKQKDARGTWGSTSATILALKALLKGMAAQKQEGTATITFRVNGEAQTIKVTPDQADVLQLVDFHKMTKKGANSVEIEVEGETNAMFQIVGRYYRPWSVVEERPEPLEIQVTYDATTISKDELLKANARIRYNGKTPTFMILVDLGIPPGFIVDESSFKKLVEEKVIERYSTTSRQVTLYFGAVRPGQEVAFKYALQPKYPIKAKTPKSTAYEYYSPDRRGESRPVEIEVKD
jgi:prenyltransferase beta subunit